MEIIKIVALGVVGAILAVTLQQQKKELALLLSVAVGTLILLNGAVWLENILKTLRQMAEQAGLSAGQIKLLLKLLAAGYVIEFGSEICKDAGQQALAAKIQIGGKLVMAGMALPIFTSLIQLITQLLT